MKKLLLILFCLPMIGFGQSVFIAGNDTICENSSFGREKNSCRIIIIL